MNDLKILKNFNVLYVDDDKDSRENLKEILSYYFGEVFLAKNGVEALQVYKSFVCNFLIVDYDMPIMNGYEFLKEIRTHDSKIPAIIVSSYDDKEKLFNAIELQLVSYLVKPYEMYELKEVLHKTFVWIKNRGLLESEISDGISYSYSSKKIYTKNKEIALSPSEFKILELLLGNENRIVSYDQLIYTIGEESTYKSLINQIYKLKKKIEVDVIKNIKDFGYIFARK